MRKWLHDRPWIWIVVLLGLLVAGGFTTLIIAELNRPEIVKEKRVSITTPATPSPSADFPRPTLPASRNP
jgi:hypothetical protein